MRFIVRQYLASTLVLISFSSATGYATEICNKNELQSCANENISSSECLQLYHACGLYHEIINHYRSEAWLNNPEKSYYIGKSFYGLYLRSRSKSAKCSYMKSAKRALEAYLRLSDKNNGYNDLDTFKQTYHASKLYKDLQSTNGCLDSSASKSEIEAEAHFHGRDTLETLFIGQCNQGALCETTQEAKQNIQTSIRGFMSKAANIENQVNMRRLAIKESSRRLEIIAETYARSFGGAEDDTENGQYATVTKNDEHVSKIKLRAPADADLITVTNRYIYTPFDINRDRGLLNYVEDFNKRLLSALGQNSIEAYENKRKEIMKECRKLNASAATNIELANKVGMDSQIDKLRSEIKTVFEGESAANLLNSIKNQWKNYGAGCDLEDKPWYCK